ncbi:MAG TPA: VOC family protein [Longimicrobiales bacterium]|nr:VOC family protein [Longimicrobiales bacterium]
MQLGYVHLRVADLDRALTFYRDVLGFTVTVYGPAVGMPVVLLAAGEYHHHLALNTHTSRGGTAPPRGHTGLDRIGIRYAGRAELARAVRRVLDYDYPLEGGEDHGCVVAVYLGDPDGNGVALYYDQPPEAWHDGHGHPVLRAEPFDPLLLVQEAARS